jgi:nitrogen regulatory protein P-II 1
MKRIEAIIREEVLREVMASLESRALIPLTVIDVVGRGEQKGLEFESYAGRYRVDLLPKKLIVMILPDGDVDLAVDAILASAQTGEIGDGKIFVSSVERCVRIRTGDTDESAL